MTTRTDHLPINRGASDANLEDYAGRIFTVDDVDWSVNTSGIKPRRTNKQVHLMLVKNSASTALLPCRGVVFKTGTGRTEVDGYNSTTAQEIAGFVDEFLPASGVPAEAYFYIVIAGPACVLPPLAGDATNVIDEGDILVALTAATSGATTAGRVAEQVLTGSSQLTDYSTLLLQVQNSVGRALSARTTGQTTQSFLADISLRWQLRR